MVHKDEPTAQWYQYYKSLTAVVYDPITRQDIDRWSGMPLYSHTKGGSRPWLTADIIYIYILHPATFLVKVLPGKISWDLPRNKSDCPCHPPAFIGGGCCCCFEGSLPEPIDIFPIFSAVSDTAVPRILPIWLATAWKYLNNKKPQLEKYTKSYLKESSSVSRDKLAKSLNFYSIRYSI